jgi:hypothetical protein
MLEARSRCYLLILVACLLNVSNAVFNEETIIYKGQQMVMPASFNVTFVPLYTSPQSLQLNRLCQVSSFQLDKFNNMTNYQYVVASKKRNNDNSCTNVQYCDNGSGMASNSSCSGVQTNIVPSDCTSTIWGLGQQELAAISQQLVTSSAGMTQTATDQSLEGLNTTLLEELSGLGSALSSSLTSQEATLIGAIAQSSAIVTQQLQESIDSLASATSAKLSQVVQDTNNALNALSSQIATQLEQVADNLENVEITLNNRISALVQEVNNIITNLNSNDLGTIQSIQSISSSLVQLAAQNEINGRILNEGIDISNLLVAWNSLVDSTVFQDPSNEYYTYVSEGMIGVYDYTQAYSLDVGGAEGIYSPDTSVQNTYAYRCYEESSTTPSVTSYSAPVPSKSKLYYYDNCFGTACPSLPSEIAYDIIERYLTTNCSSYDTASWLTAISAVNVSYIEIGSITTTTIVDTSGAAHAQTDNYMDLYMESNYPTNGYITISKCNFTNTATFISEPSLYTHTVNRSDSGRYVILSSQNVNPTLETMMPDSYTFVSKLDNTIDVLQNTPAKYRINNTYSYSYSSTYMSVSSSPNHFTLMHPTMGQMNIHRCERLINGYLTTYPSSVNSQSSAFGITNGTGQVLPGIYNQVTPGLRNVNAFGNIGTSVNLVVQTTNAYGEPIPNMEPDPYYYVTDVWCCDTTGVPVQTVNNTIYCSVLGYKVCDSALFGYCTSTSSSKVDVRKLVINQASYSCPSGYNNQPNSTFYMYKSPRIYYCSGTYKFASSYGIELQFCTTGTAKLPGAGVIIETGINAPGGLYPAECIFWNSVQGVVPIYSIDVSLTDQIVPTMISQLNNEKIAYYTSASIVIDERDKLYGPENSGYDCVTYEMDKILHDPKNCINYAMPTYDVSAYFSGKVRSTGISALLDYFDITPIYTNGQVIMNFALLDGIDYEAAYIRAVDPCPVLQVAYQESPSTCILSGWPTVAQADVQIYVGTQVTCDPNSGSCVNTINVPNGGALNITVIDSTGATICNSFRCLSSTSLFVAYPVQTFSTTIQRPNMDAYINTYNDTDLVNQFNDQISAVNSAISTMYSNLTEAMDRIVINTTLDYYKANVNLSSVYAFINDSYSANIQQLQQDINKIGQNVSNNIAQTIALVNATIAAEVNSTLQQLNQTISNYTQAMATLMSMLSDGGAGLDLSKAKVSVPSEDANFSGDKLSGSASGKLNVDTGMAATALMLSIIAIAIGVYQCLCGGKKGVSI